MSDEVKAPELTKEQQEFLDAVKNCATEVNGILTKYNLQFTVTHKIVVDTELKREEIIHDIILKPAPKA